LLDDRVEHRVEVTLPKQASGVFERAA